MKNISWPLRDLSLVLPHRPPMILLDELIAYDENSATAKVEIRADSLFADQQGHVPTWIALEFMAQTVAAYAGMTAILQGNPIQLGFLLGTRNCELAKSHFYSGELLIIHVERHARVGELDAFRGQVLNHPNRKVLANCILNVFQPKDSEHFLKSNLNP